MKTKLEAIANIMVILVALAVGALVLTRYAASSRLPRSVAAGDHLATLPGLDWSLHRHTLVLALNTGCHFCEESVPFYQKLGLAQRPNRSDLDIVAVFPNGPELVGPFTARDDLSLRTVPGIPLEKLGVHATPTLILMDDKGRVEHVWIGVLTARQETNLLKLASGP